MISFIQPGSSYDQAQHHLQVVEVRQEDLDSHRKGSQALTSHRGTVAGTYDPANPNQRIQYASTYIPQETEDHYNYDYKSPQNRLERISAHDSSNNSENSSFNDLVQKGLTGDQLKEPTATKTIENEHSVNVLVKRKQWIIFGISYAANFLGLLGLSYQFVTSTFYFDPEKTDENVSLSDIQVILLVTSVMYLLLGSILEYIKKADLFITIIIAIFGVLKIFISIYDYFIPDDLEVIVFDSIQLVHFIIVFRLGVSTILMIGLAKWFSRTNLPLIFGIWFTTEYLAYKLTWVLWEYKNGLLMVSGVLLTGMAYLFHVFYRFDPIDSGFLVNEQAINLTSQHTGQFQSRAFLSDFLDQVHTSKLLLRAIKNLSFDGIRGSYLDNTEEKMRKVDERQISYQQKILKRWKVPSLLKTLKLPGVLQMVICTIFLFFKYRLINKQALMLYQQAGYNLVGCYLAASELIQILIGFLILKQFKGRKQFLDLTFRVTIQIVLLLTLLIIEIFKLIFYALSRLNFDQYSAVIFCSLQGIIGYSLYYTTCITGPIDISKIEMLKHNIKYVGMLLCVVTGFQTIVQALILDELIERFLTNEYFMSKKNFYVISFMEILSTTVSIVALYPMFLKEFRELRTFAQNVRRSSDIEHIEQMLLADHSSERSGVAQDGTGSDDDQFELGTARTQRESIGGKQEANSRSIRRNPIKDKKTSSPSDRRSETSILHHKNRQLKTTFASVDRAKKIHNHFSEDPEVEGGISSLAVDQRGRSVIQVTQPLKSKKLTNSQGVVFNSSGKIVMSQKEKESSYSIQSSTKQNRDRKIGLKEQYLSQQRPNTASKVVSSDKISGTSKDNHTMFTYLLQSQNITNDSQNISTQLKKEIFNRQLIIFTLSYVANLLILLGLKPQFITISFFNNGQSTEDSRVQLQYPDVQIILLASSFMYFTLGSLIEFTKHADRILIVFLVLIAITKLVSGLCALIGGFQIASELADSIGLQFIHLIVAIRLGVLAIMLTALARWISRYYLHLLIVIYLLTIQSSWLTNEFLAFLINSYTADQSDLLMTISGTLLLITAVLMLYKFKIDPVDAGYILHEQAVNLTAAYTHSIRYAINLMEFVEKIREKDAPKESVIRKTTTITFPSAQKVSPSSLSSEEEQILKRWDAPSFLAILRTQDCLRLLLISGALFYKYRVLNQSAANTNIFNGMSTECFFLATSLTVLITIGVLMLTFLKGRRYSFNYCLLFFLVLIELSQLIVTAIIPPDNGALSTINKIFFVIQGPLLYILYFSFTVICILDLSKVHMLRYNIKLVCIMLCTINGIIYFIQGLLLDWFIYRFPLYDASKPNDRVNPSIRKGLEILASVIALGATYALYTNELSEIEQLNPTQLTLQNVLPHTPEIGQISLGGHKTNSNQNNSSSLSQEERIRLGAGNKQL